MDSQKTGAFIAMLRKEKKLTQMELAQLLHVSDKTISKWETGRGMPDTALLKPLSEALGVSIGELLTGARMEETEVRQRTDEVIVESLRKPDRKIAWIALSVSVLAAIIFILMFDLVPQRWRRFHEGDVITDREYAMRFDRYARTITCEGVTFGYAILEDNTEIAYTIVYPNGNEFTSIYQRRNGSWSVKEEKWSDSDDTAQCIPGQVLAIGLHTANCGWNRVIVNEASVIRAICGVMLILIGLGFLWAGDVILESLFGWIYAQSGISRTGSMACSILGAVMVTAGIVLFVMWICTYGSGCRVLRQPLCLIRGM